MSAAQKRPGGWVQLALFTQASISAGTYLVAKAAMVHLRPFPLVLWRFVFSAVAFTLVLLLTRGPVLPPRRAWLQAAWLGFLVGPLNQVLFFTGLARTVPAHGALLYALTPLGVYVVSVAQGLERPNGKALVGLGTALAGVLVLLLAGGLRSLAGIFQGDLFILAAVACWVLYTSEGKRFVTEHGPIRGTAWPMMAAALMLLPFGEGVLHPVQALRAGPALWGCVFYLGVVVSVGSYTLWYFGLSRARPSQVAVFANLQPVLTALAARVLLGNALHWELGVGGGLVLLGVRLTQQA